MSCGLVLFNERKIAEPGIRAFLRGFLRAQGKLEIDLVDVTKQGWLDNAKKKPYQYYLLCGDFGNHSTSSISMGSATGSLNQNLIQFWLGLTSPRSILSFADLHFGVNRILFGKHIDFPLERYNLEELAKQISESVNCFFWWFERNNYDSDFIDPDNDSLNHANLRRVKSEIRSLFPCRVDTPWLISNEEFVNLKSLAFIKRKYDVYVPGRNYRSRYSVMREVESHSFLIPPYKKLDKAIRDFFYRLNKLNINADLDLRQLEFHFRFRNQQFWLPRTKLTYTDGNHIDYLVRKFLEIPSGGGVLFTPKSTVLSNYGFIPGHHFVPAGDINEVLMNYQGELEKIMHNSYEFIREKFSLEKAIPKIISFACEFQTRNLTLARTVVNE